MMALLSSDIVQISNGAPQGIILIDKPCGPSSFDVVRTVRRLLRVKRVGHAGTLDPLASGLMVVCVGRYTKLACFLTEENKVYDARFRLGVTTTTDDGEGQVITERDATSVSREAITTVLSSMLGSISQRPPRFSAIKINGKRAYAKARADEEFDIAARDITIFDIDNVEIIGTEIALRIHCSKGTYIRSLARDVGAILGVGAYASAIRRVRSGGLDVKDAIAYDQLCADSIQQALCRGRRALSHLPLIELTSLQRDELRLGRNICETMALTSSMAIAIHDDEPIAILRNDGARTDLARVM